VWFAACVVAGVDGASRGGEGGAEEDDDDQDAEEEGSSDSASAAQGTAGDVGPCQEAQRGDAATAAVQAGGTGHGARGRDRKHQLTVHQLLLKRHLQTRAWNKNYCASGCSPVKKNRDGGNNFLLFLFRGVP